MSSTYSPNLAIELMGAGDQAGNWGSTTNTNLGTLIEQAISGYVTQAVATGTDTTLAMTSGASATARNMFLELTGTGGASTNLVVPANKKLYFIYNNTSSGQVTVKVSGQTGVSVPNLAKVVLVCNGTDVVVATNYMANATLPSATLSNATLSSPTLTGTPVAPTASAGTNTTQIATTAFVQANILVGEIKMWGTSSAPSGYLICNGAAVSRTTYAALFAVYGTVFGTGDGSTTFNLPNFTDRMPIGAGSTYSLAATGGSATTTLAEANLPSHSHTLSTSTTGITISQNAEQYNTGHQLAGGGSFTVYPTPATITINDPGHTHTVGNTGSGTAFTNLPPYLGIYYIIKT
jgi:microcystin-dependent protein